MMIRGLAIPNSIADVDPSISGLWLLRNVGLSETMSQTGRYKCNKLVKRPFFGCTVRPCGSADPVGKTARIPP